MAGRSRDSSVPVWAIPVAVVAVVLIIGFFAWRAFGKDSSSGDGPPVPVHAGMYDFRKEAAGGHLGGGPSALKDSK